MFFSVRIIPIIIHAMLNAVISLKRNRKTILAILLVVVLATAALALNVKRADAPNNDSGGSNKSSRNPGSYGANSFDKTQYSLEDPDSIWVVVNKKRPLPDGYAPTDLDGDIRREPAKKLEELLRAAQNGGHNLYRISGFRSQENQTLTYNSYVSRDGQARADTYSARPRHSEHQTGLAIDLGNGTCDLEACFGDTKSGKWLAAHAYEYGFIIRYLKGKEHITGYQYEPWHLRYVGVPLSTELYKSGQTMEEFFGLPPAPNY